MQFFSPFRIAPLVVVFGCLTTHARSQTIAAPQPAAPASAATASPGVLAGYTVRAMASAYTFHYSRSPDHRHVYMLGLELQDREGFIAGGTAFTNSFGQPSTYLYVGKRYEHLAGYDPLFAQVTGGLLYGYKPPFEKKVPLNYRGFSPGAVLSVGWQFTPKYSAQLNFLGNSALMFQVSADFP